MKSKRTQPILIYVSNIVMLLLTYFSSIAQTPYQWLTPEGDYVRIKTHTTGMHILLRDELIAAGLSPTADPRTFKLFHRGKEQAIHIVGESNGTFDATDTILFYGQRNDGTLDVPQYKAGTQPPHSFLNMNSDTCVYFLSWEQPGTPRRMPTLNTATGSNQEFHFDEVLHIIKDDYVRGEFYSKNTETILDLGEVWSSRFFNPGNPQTFTVTGIQQVYATGPAATLTVQVLGRNSHTPNRKVIFEISGNGNPIIKDSVEGFPDFHSAIKSISIPLHYLTSGGLSIRVVPVDDAGEAPNELSVNYISLRYPQAINSSMALGKTLRFSSSGISTINSEWNGSGVYFYDISVPDSVKLVETDFSANTVSANIPAGSITLWTGNNTSLLRPSSLRSFHFTMPDTTGNYLIVSHSTLKEGTDEYAAYRSSPAGGNHEVRIEYTDNLYDVFSYGEFSPLAIRNYCLYQQEKNPSAEFLLLIGKGVDPYFRSWDGANDHNYRWDPDYFHNQSGGPFKFRNMVPPYGSPASDQYYVVDNANIPFMSVGRISSRNNEQIIAYLDKVKEHELVDSNYSWRKNIVHLSGGSSPDEINRFKLVVDGFKNIAENSMWGGKVIKTITKPLNSSEIITKVSITDEVNAGVSYINYFGHSASTLLEIDIGNVSVDHLGYHNKGKYPMLIMNGCSSGHVYVSYSLAEDWINTADRGAILVFGSSDEAYTDQLTTYTIRYYQEAFNNPLMMGKSTGEIIRHILTTTGGSLNRFIRSQMNLHGDPAVSVYQPSQTDYEISGDEEDRDDHPEQKVFLKTPDGSRLTAATPEFSIGIPIKNFGRLNSDTFSILVRRTINNQTISYPIVYINPIRYLDTAYFQINQNNLLSNFGLNRFEIFIDHLDSIPEMREDNNYATLNYFMQASAVTCLFPKEFSIVHTQPITFVAQSTDLMIDRTDYYFELDTSYFFNSSFKRSTIISSGALAKWENQSLLSDNNSDSIVYYWRVRLNNVPNGQDTIWGTSSFVYIKNSPDGWSQSRMGQYTKNDFNRISMSVENQQWEFSPSRQKIAARSFGNGDVADINDLTTLSIGNLGFLFPGYWITACWDGPNMGENTATEFNGMYAVAFDKSSLEIYHDMPGWKCGRIPFLSPQINLSSPQNRDNFVSWLNQVPDQYYVLMGSSGNAYFDDWGDINTDGTLRHALATHFGATLMNELNNNEPYILLSQKGGTPIAEKHSNDVFSSVVLDTTITSRNNNGTLYSTIIGPSRQWGTFYKRVDSLDGRDHSLVGLIRFHTNGTSDTLKNLTFSKNMHNIDTLDLSTLMPDASQYPNIKLFVQLSDTALTLTPPRLDKWQVIYHKVPEGSMNPYLAGLQQYSESGRLDEGTPLCYQYVFENISDLPFDDSLKVTASIFNALTGQRDSTFLVSADSLKPGQSVRFPYCFSSTGLSGNSTFRMFVNPGFQPEEYYNNNVIETYANIDRDRTPPVIDVTFDGAHILDGDIVSPNPMIRISLHDNSTFLLMHDPAAMSLFLKRPGSATTETITHEHPDILRFGQDGGKSNEFSIEYNPKNLPDGIYTITIQGSDVNGNKSGNLYSISFEVINASTISNMYPYPNPFSSSTQFVFTLTGNEIPEDLKIQIMTVTGKVVREITKDELGAIRIGNNRTSFAWNGTDEFGDKLANGVYLYRVVIKNRGDNFQHRESGGDKSFTKEFGKLYILR